MSTSQASIIAPEHCSAWIRAVAKENPAAALALLQQFIPPMASLLSSNSLTALHCRSNLVSTLLFLLPEPDVYLTARPLLDTAIGRSSPYAIGCLWKNPQLSEQEAREVVTRMASHLDPSLPSFLNQTGLQAEDAPWLGSALWRAATQGDKTHWYCWQQQFGASCKNSQFPRYQNGSGNVELGARRIALMGETEALHAFEALVSTQRHYMGELSAPLTRSQFCRARTSLWLIERASKHGYVWAVPAFCHLASLFSMQHYERFGTAFLSRLCQLALSLNCQHQPLPSTRIFLPLYPWNTPRGEFILPPAKTCNFSQSLALSGPVATRLAQQWLGWGSSLDIETLTHMLTQTKSDWISIGDCPSDEKKLIQSPEWEAQWEAALLALNLTPPQPPSDGPSVRHSIKL